MSPLRWKSQASSTIERLKSAVEQLLLHNNLPDLAECNTIASIPTTNPEPTIQTLSPYSCPSHPTDRDFTAEGPLNTNQDNSDLIPLPMNNLYSLADAKNSHLIRVDPGDANGPDLIDQGILSLEEAEFLFGHFRDHINPLLWDGILCSHTSLQQVRESSSFLMAVILTVSALHIPEREHLLAATYGAFVSLMRGSCLLRCDNLDVVRALCIGAFHLTSLSWALCSRAVRVATEINLHKSSLQFARGSLESYERVRLWYILYVCDHQFALAYGRPPMMHEDASIRNAQKLLTSGLSSRGDHGLVAQVKLFRILADSYFMYGCDPDLELGAEDFERVHAFNVSVDQWRLEHQSARPAEPSTDSLAPAKGNALYYHLARFQLNSVALRGISARLNSKDDLKAGMSWDRQEAANNATIAAMSTVRLITEDSELQDALIGLPIFTHAMIAVCASFLLKLAVVFGEPASAGEHSLSLPNDLTDYGLNFQTKIALTNVERLARVLSRVADKASQRHVARQVVTGLEELLQRFSAGQTPDSIVYSQSPSTVAISLAKTGSAPNNDLYVTSNDVNDNTTPTNLDATEPQGLPDFPDYQQGLFDLTGDLDWRFDSGFLLGIDGMVSEMPYL
jgi:hypothetical protein